MGWQPIETAPKGKRVLLFVPATKFHPASIEADFVHVWNRRNPTHWQPLPEPPETDK